MRPQTWHILGPRATFERAEGDLLNVQALLADVDTLLRHFAGQRTGLSHDPRIQHNGDLVKLARADARDINEALNRVAACRELVGASRDALEAYYRQGVSRTEEGA